MIESPYRTLAEVAAHYRLSEKTVRYWREMGVGPVAVRVGKHLRYHVDEIDRYDAELKQQQERKAS